jgi:hypothetical protein
MNKKGNHSMYNNIIDILPLLQQISKTNSINTENIQNRGNPENYLNNNLNNFNNENPLNNDLVENINELLIRELENLLNLSDKIDENIFEKIKNNFVILIKSQNGSRVFQKFLKNTHPLIIKKIFSHIYPLLIELLLNPYANYFCQKFFLYLEKEDRFDFLKKVIFISIIKY